MKLKRLTALLAAAIIPLSLGACQYLLPKQQVSSSEPKEVEVDPNWPVQIGEIEILERPKKLVSLSPALTELLCELGAGDRLVGVSDFCDYPSEIDTLPDCGTPQLPNRSALEDLSPELVFMSSAPSSELAAWLEKQRAQVVVLPYCETLVELEENYVTAATLIDGKKDGEQGGMKVFSKLRKRYDALTDAATQIPERMNGIYLRAAPLMMATGDTFEQTLLDTIGIDNDAKEYTGWAYPADKSADLYPKIIFYDYSIDPEYFAGTPVYNTTDAFKNELLIPIDASAFERQSGRMVSELEKMFAAAYPDITVSGAASAPESSEQADGASSADDATESGLASGGSSSGSSAPADGSSSATGDDEMLDINDATKVA